jgi:hypothetical protein
LRCTLTRVLGPTALRAWLAACWGVSGSCDGKAAGGLAAWPSRAGHCMRVTVLELLCQTQPWRPLRITSVSDIVTGTASRICVGSAYQILIVCEPASSAVTEFGSAEPGS